MKRWAETAIVGILLPTYGCVVHESPPAYPEAPSRGSIEKSPLADGTGRVAIDSNPPTRIHLILSESTATASYKGGLFGPDITASARGTRILCDTPCVVDLPLGLHKVILKPRKEDNDIEDHEKVIVVKSQRSPLSYGVVFSKSSGSNHNAGGVLIGLGFASSLVGYASYDSENKTKILPIGLMVAGLAGIATGSKLVFTPAYYQKGGAVVQEVK